MAQEIHAQPFQLIDVGKIADEELCKHLWSGTMEFVFKHIYSPDIIRSIKKIMPQFKRLDQEKGDSVLQVLLNYILQQVETQDVNKLVSIVCHSVSEQTGEKIMTGAEQLRAQGYEKGMQQGMQRGMQRGMKTGVKQGQQAGKHQEQVRIISSMLRNDVEPAQIAALTGLSLAAVYGMIKEQAVTG